MQKKGFVVEVQSHQQALKSANPITDLEQTISRGMNDPYTDPKFVMNQINEEFFGNNLKNNFNAGTPLVENNLHNRELMAFRNLPFSPQALGMNSLPGSLLPGNPMMQHAVKDNNVAMREPAQAIDQALSRLFKFRNTAKKHLSVGKAPMPYDAPKLTGDPRVPSNVRIAHLTSDSINPSEEKQEDPSSRGLPANVELDQSSNFNEKIDASAPSVADATEKGSDSSGNIGESSSNVGDTLSSMLTQNGPKSSDILPSNPGSISSKEMEDNFSSIKAFIDADDDLRQKKVIDPVRNPLEDLLHSKHKKHKVPKARKTLRKIITS